MPPVAFRTALERVAGIEPASSAWKAEVLPLNYTRRFTDLFSYTRPVLVLAATSQFGGGGRI